MPARRPEKEWEEIGEAWRASGQSIEAFCKGRRVSSNSFRHFLKRQKKGAVVSGNETGFVELGSMAVSPPHKPGKIILRVSTAAIIELETGFDEAALRAVLRVLGVVR